MRSLALLLGALLLAGCEDRRQDSPVPPRPVRAERITPAAFEFRDSFAGTVRAHHEIPLSFRVPGRILSRHVEVGDTVSAGTLVAELDPADLRARLDSAEASRTAGEADLANLRADLARFRDLQSRGFISKTELDRRDTAVKTAEARLRQAVAALAESRNQLSYARLGSPKAGVVTSVEAEAGQVVAAGQTVARVALPGEKEALIAVPEGALDQLRRADRIELVLWTQPGRSYRGRLRELAPAADAATRTYAAKITFVAPDDAVKLGMTVTASISRGTHAGAIRVPLAALFQSGKNFAVWVVDPKTSQAALRPVATGAFSGNQVVVSGGLAPGDWVVTAGATQLHAGQKVRILQDSPR